MFARVISSSVTGVEAFPVEIEVNTAKSQQPKIVVVGLPDTAVKESRDRVITAISNSGYHWPREHVTVNLAPADVVRIFGSCEYRHITRNRLRILRFIPEG